MESKNLILILSFQVFLIILLLIVVYNLFKVRKSLKNERRISLFTINSTKEERLSIGDEIRANFNSFINKISIHLSKINYFKNNAKKYIKYQTKDNDEYFIYRVIAQKFLISLGFSLMYLISSLSNTNFNLLFFIIFLILGYYLIDLVLNIYYKRRIKLIEADLLKAIIVMNNAFKSGYNITQAIAIVVKDLKGPISEEFEKIGNDLKFGLEVKDVFNRFYERIKLEDAKYITSSLSLLNITGGNIVGVFTSIENSLTNKKRLRDELNTMTSSSNLVYKVLIAMPFILIGLITLLNPDYFKPLFTSLFGYAAILFVLILFIIYIIIIKKILKVDIWKMIV